MKARWMLSNFVKEIVRELDRVKELVVNHCVNSQPPLTAYF